MKIESSCNSTTVRFVPENTDELEAKAEAAWRARPDEPMDAAQDALDRDEQAKRDEFYDDRPFGEEQPMIDYLETRYDGYDGPDQDDYYGEWS